jgi:polysaccharide pyruvyl transferase WcaK-like protein
MRRPSRLLLLGSNSGRNAGDLALLDTVVDQVALRRPGTVFEIPTTNPRFIASYFAGRNVLPFSIMPWTGSVRLLGIPTLASLRRCDLSLILDGIIFDHRLLNPAFNFLITLVFLAPFARLVGRPMVPFEVGVGPLDTPLGKWCARVVGNCSDLILVREEDSARLLAEAGVNATPVERYADAAFICRSAPAAEVDRVLAGLGLGGRPLLGLNLNRYGGAWLGKEREFDRAAFQRLMAGVVDRVVEETGAAVILTATQHMDRDYCRETAALVRNQAAVRVVSNVELSPPLLAGLLGRMECFVGMRLHSLILASSVKTPILGLVYAPKVQSLFDLLERPDLSVPLAELDPRALGDRILTFWENRAAERERLSPGIDRLKSLAARGFDRLVERYLP